MAELYLGLARARLGAAAAIVDAECGIVAACEENRLTRARQAAASGPPELAIAELCRYLDRSADDFAATAVVVHGADTQWAGDPDGVHVDAHAAHAAYAFRSSGFDDALVLVAEVHSGRGWSLYQGSGIRDQGSGVQDRGPAILQGSGLEAFSDDFHRDIGDFPIARIYGLLTTALGFQATRDEHLVEALARAGRPGNTRAADLVVLDERGLHVADGFGEAGGGGRTGDQFVAEISRFHGGDEQMMKNVAASIQQRLGETLVELLRRVAGGRTRICLSGGLFFNTYFTTLAATCGVFRDVHVPPHPGRNGCALGAALLVGPQATGPRPHTTSLRSQATGAKPRRADSLIDLIRSPFLGPAYRDGEIKEVLDNCKLSYDFVQGDRLNDAVIHALSRGRLVGWFHGRLEWGPRALGHRSVLADPFATHALDNLNGFLKRRPSYRSYGVSVPFAQLHRFFEGPRPVAPGPNDRAPGPWPQASGGNEQAPGPWPQAPGPGPQAPHVNRDNGARRGADGPLASPFMQYEYRPRDPEKFRTILPPGVETMRVHTVDESEPRFLRLLEMWGEATGTPVLVNTSFNGFHEPLVCSPRDAIRVFYGTGLDVLALEDFLLRK